jgi:hypothetical protein
MVGGGRPNTTCVAKAQEAAAHDGFLLPWLARSNKLAHHRHFIADQKDSVVRSSDHVEDLDTFGGGNLQ